MSSDSKVSIRYMEVTICKDEKSAIDVYGNRYKIHAIEIVKADKDILWYGSTTSFFKAVMAKATKHSAYINKDEKVLIIQNRY